MAPLLLDSRSLFKLSSFVLTGMVVMFAGGYLLGYDTAIDRPGRVSVPVAMLPEPAHADVAAYEPQVPETIEPGLHIDVDLPDPPAETGTPPVTIFDTAHVDEDPSAHEDTAAAAAPGQEQHAPVQVALLDLPAEVASDAMAASAVIGQADEPDTVPALNTPQFAVVDTATPESARYSVQIGMFADRANAERNLRELESIELNAYIDEYTNARDETRFNVRFGWFGRKADALAALSAYESTHGGRGYVVYLKREMSDVR